MPCADNKLLAVESERPDGAPVVVRGEDFPLDPDLGDEDMDEEEPLMPPSPFIRPL